MLPGGVTQLARLVIAAQQAVEVELYEILSLFHRQQQRLHERLLPAHHPRVQCVLDEFQALVLNIAEGGLLQIADQVERDTKNPGDLIQLELAGLEELRGFLA